MNTAHLYQTVEMGKDAAWNTLSFPLLVPISLSVYLSTYLSIYICGSQIFLSLYHFVLLKTLDDLKDF